MKSKYMKPKSIFSLLLVFSCLNLFAFAQEDEKNVNETDDSSFELQKIDKHEESVLDNSESEAESSESYKKEKKTVLKGHVSKVPGGTKLKIILETPIDESVSMIDDEITARIAENVLIEGMVIIPAGSTVIGKISEINPAKRLHKSGTVRIEFKNLTMPDGREAPIVASALTHSGLIKGKLTKKSALISTATIIGPAAAGFGAGLAAEGSLVGAGIGALVGTLAGAGLFAFQRGNMVELKSGDELNIELTEEALVPVEEELEEGKFCDLEKNRP